MIVVDPEFDTQKLGDGKKNTRDDDREILKVFGFGPSVADLW